MKKYAVILGLIAIVFLMVVTLLGNKRKLDQELKTMQQYTSIVPVQVVSPRIVQAKKTVEESGVLRASAEISVLSETTGKVLSVNADVGEHVSAGQILASVEKDVIESQYTLVKTTLENAKKDLERYSKLATGEAVTQQQLEASTAAYQNANANFTVLKKQLENTEIRSPVFGTIARRSIEKGTSLTPSMALFSILEQDQMVFTAKMTETDLTGIKRGQHVVTRFDALPQTDFTGTVISIGVSPDLSGRYDVEMNIDNHRQQLRAGMSGTALFEIALRDSALVVPRKCIIGSIKEATVFIQKGDSVMLQGVTVEPLNESEVMVSSGLTVQEKIVTSGQINLRQGSKIKVIN
jgi:RND family efflux transporter MFP subunit